jgi:integrase
MTIDGLRSIFRYHRATSRVPVANAHRFRHTFGAEMVRAGISLPALMKLMGHSTIYHTMLYVEVSPEDVRREFNRVVQKLRAHKLRLQDDEDA